MRAEEAGIVPSSQSGVAQITNGFGDGSEVAWGFHPY